MADSKLYKLMKNTTLTENSRAKKMRRAYKTILNSTNPEEVKKAEQKIAQNNAGRLAAVDIELYKKYGDDMNLVSAAHKVNYGKDIKSGKEDPDLTVREVNNALDSKSGSKSFKDSENVLKDKLVRVNENCTFLEFMYKLGNSDYVNKYNTLNESILDPINKERCPDVFVNDVMKASVRNFILKLAKDFQDQSEADFNFRALYLVGSTTGFQYSLTSDIDVTCMIDLPKDQWKDVSAITPKGILLPGTQRPVNFFLIMKEDEYDFNHAENVYDIQNNKWLKKTDKSNVKIPYPYIKELATFFMNGCELALSKYRQDKQELEEYISLDPKRQEISETERAEAIDRKLVDFRNDLDLLKMAHHIIWSFEREGYENMPFKVSIELEKNDDPRYSVNNLVYKMIDRFGYLDRLNQAVKEGWKIIEDYEGKK